MRNAFKKPTIKRIPTCFVVMPFSDTAFDGSAGERRITKLQWNHIYDRWIKRAVETYRPTRYVCKRSTATPGNFVKGIVGDLADAELVIADLTGGRPNVYYELGIRHTLRTGTVIITQHLNALPSDLAGYYTFEYGYSERDYEYEQLYAEFERELHGKIQALEEAEDFNDSPVSDFLGLRHEVLRRQGEDEAAALRWLLGNLKNAVIKNCEICEDLVKMAQALQPGSRRKEPELRHLPFVDLFYVEVLYERLLTTGWSAFPTDALQKLVNLIGDVRENLLLAQRLWERVQGGGADAAESMGALLTVSEVVGTHKNAFERVWDRLVDTLSEVKIRKTPRKRRKPARALSRSAPKRRGE